LSKELQRKLLDGGCKTAVGYDNWTMHYGTGYIITTSLKQYLSDTTTYSLEVASCSCETEEVVYNAENIAYVLVTAEREKEIAELKVQASMLQKLNRTSGNSKASKLLRLALDRACSFGELRNSVTLCSNILRRRDGY
jgi:hypothetical protein